MTTMKRLQRKISVKADALRRKSFLTNQLSSSVEDIALEEQPSPGASRQEEGEEDGARRSRSAKRVEEGSRNGEEGGKGRKMSVRKVEEGRGRLQRAQTVTYEPGRVKKKVGLDM